MENDELVVRLARAEVNERRFPVTQTILAVHEVSRDPHGDALVLRVDATTEVGAYHVYFALADESYHFVVTLRQADDGELGVSWVYIQPDVRVYLSIRSDRVDAREIARRISLEPTRVRVKGEPRRREDGPKWSQHVCDFEVLARIPGGLDEKLRELLKMLAPVRDNVAPLQTTCEVNVVVVFRSWGGNPQFGHLQFDARTTREIAALGAGVDVDLYSFGPLMEEDRADADARRRLKNS